MSREAETSSARADTPALISARVEAAPDRSAVPQGDVAALVAFIEALRSFRAASPKEASEHQAKAPAALRQATARILELEKDQTWPAYKMAVPALAEKPIPIPPASKQSPPALLEPDAGAVLPNGALDRSKERVWQFSWAAVPGARKYPLRVQRRGARIPVVDKSDLTTTTFRHIEKGYVAGHNLANWTCKVRAQAEDGWTEWSAERVFEVAPPN